jgi:hypothetical protein
MAESTYAVVATLVLLSPALCVVAVVPLGNADIADRLDALPVTLPVIGFVTVRLTSVPTDVRLEEVTPAARVFPVSVPAGAALRNAKLPGVPPSFSSVPVVLFQSAKLPDVDDPGPNTSPLPIMAVMTLIWFISVLSVPYITLISNG